jgi:hypothetical protein
MAKKRKKVRYETPLAAALAGDLQAFLELGGVRALEHEAVQATRREWLSVLEQWRAACADAGADWVQVILDLQIRTLRRQLGVKQTIEERRAKVLERVRKHRAAKKATQAGPKPGRH